MIQRKSGAFLLVNADGKKMIHDFLKTKVGMIGIKQLLMDFFQTATHDIVH